MKTIQKLSAVVLTGSMLLSAMPVPAAWAATEDDTTEPMTATITLNGDSASADGENVSISGTTITISASGSYQFSGELTDGQICVNVPDETADPGTVKLYLSGASITGKSAAALYIVNAENTSVNLAAGTENYLSDDPEATAVYDATLSETTAVIYAKDDITFKGEGSLRVDAAQNYGLHCNNDVKINGGNIKFKTTGTVNGDAIRGKNSVEIKDGVIDINAEGDGIKSTKGTVTILGGTIEVKSGKDAIQGETALDISGGSVKANGDRGLRLTTGSINITGGSVLATATDYQANDATSGSAITATQPVVMFDLTAEQLKDQAITLKKTDGTEVFSMTPDKKFSYILISDPALALSTAYQLTIGSSTVTAGGSSSFVLSEEVTEFSDAALKTSISIDVDLNGSEELADVVFLARMIAEDSSLSSVVTADMAIAADINKDSYVNALDLMIALRYLSGQTTSL